MSDRGALPDFLVIGAMKAGTTTLYEYLSRHPEVGMSREKETDFLIEERNWRRGLDWYRGQFDPNRKFRGEASPNYTKKEAFPGVPERAARLLPEARLIFVARDPVERAASQYRHAALSGAKPPRPEALMGSRHLRHLVEVSSYASQLEPWLERFPRERFLFLRFEDLVADPGPSLTRVAGFLGIADEWPSGGIAANSGESLARLPPWLFRFRETAAAAWLKERLPAGWRNGLKARLRARQAREAADLGPEARAEIAARLAEDMARFRALSGLAA